MPKKRKDIILIVAISEAPPAFSRAPLPGGEATPLARHFFAASWAELGEPTMT